MTQIILPKKHYFLTINEDIKAICEPLVQHGICYFNYSRFFNDNSAYILTTDKDSVFSHINNQYPIDKPAPKWNFGKKFHYFPFLDSPNISHKHVLAYRDEFNLEHPFYFVEKHNAYTDIFVFCSIPNNLNILNFYLNNLEFLEKFKLYFRDKANKLIEKCSRNKIIIPNHMWSNYSNSDNSTINNIKKNQDRLDLKRYFFNLDNQEVSITQKQFNVIKHLALGYSLKEIARILNLSLRTIETYLNNVKYKLKVKNKSELIKIVIENNLL